MNIVQLNKNKGGFTLIELLVVISIMSILTIITASQFQGASRKARDVSRKGDINGLSKAIQTYFADYGVFPEESEINGLIGADGSGGEFKDAGGYVYMKKTPLEKNASMPPFCYVTTADRKKYAILAMLENRSDTDCKLTQSGGPLYGYYCNQNIYCYAVVSPNAVMSDFTPNPGLPI